MIEEIIVFIMLLGATFYDLKSKSIPVKYLAAFGLIEALFLVGYIVYAKDFTMGLRGMLGIVPGIVCLLISYISREQMGFGDGWVMILIGMLLGYEKTIICFLIGLMLMVIIAIVLIFIKKVGKKTKMPFIPFLLVSYLVIMLC